MKAGEQFKEHQEKQDEFAAPLERMFEKMQIEVVGKVDPNGHDSEGDVGDSEGSDVDLNESMFKDIEGKIS